MPVSASLYFCPVFQLVCLTIHLFPSDSVVARVVAPLICLDLKLITFSALLAEFHWHSGVIINECVRWYSGSKVSVG